MDVDDEAFVPQPQSVPTTGIAPNGSVVPFTTGTGTYAVSASVSTAFNLILNNPIWLRGFSIIPLSSTISVAFYFRYGSWSIGTNPPVVNSSLTIAGTQFVRNFKDGTGRYPQLNASDPLQLIVVASGSGFISVDIDAEYVFTS